MSWQRIDNKHNLRNEGGNIGVRRVYGLNGKLFPRIVIGVNNTNIYGYEGFQVSASYKKKSGSWWDECSIPIELRNEMVELVKEFSNKEGELK